MIELIHCIRDRVKHIGDQLRGQVDAEYGLEAGEQRRHRAIKTRAGHCAGLDQRKNGRDSFAHFKGKSKVLKDLVHSAGFLERKDSIVDVCCKYGLGCFLLPPAQDPMSAEQLLEEVKTLVSRTEVDNLEIILTALTECVIVGTARLLAHMEMKVSQLKPSGSEQQAPLTIEVMS